MWIWIFKNVRVLTILVYSDFNVVSQGQMETNELNITITGLYTLTFNKKRYIVECYSLDTI